MEEFRMTSEVTQLQEAIDREKNDPHEKVIPIWELAKYRLNKKIPKNLTFKERKKLLTNSIEWNGWIHKNNKHLTEEELQITKNTLEKMKRLGEEDVEI